MRLRRSAAIAVAIVGVTAGLALAAPVKLSSTPLARGTWDRAERTQFLAALGAQGKLDASDVFMVRATLGPADSSDPTPGTTDWHTHTGPSVVVVTQGTLTVSMPMAAGGCTTREVGAGQAVFHDSAAHNFVNNGSVPAEFYVVYFVPAGPVLTPASNPGC